MKKFRNRIPNEVLKEIFPKKLKRSLASEKVYAQLKKMILSGKLKKGQRLLQDGIAQEFNVSKMAVTIAFSRLRKERLLISKRGAGSFVA
jgi:DNA-binding GntR family transcriptional regulator